MTITTPARIAVIGGGPGGLTAARVLQRHGIAATVYERDASPAVRAQGGTLDMHADTGQVALAAAGLLEEFLTLARPEGQAMRLADKTGRILVDKRVEPGEMFNPEIDRGDLRQLLLDSLEPDTVRFGKILEKVAPVDDGQHELQFRDGSRVTADLVIGADGAWSKVRPLVSPAVPFYEGVTFVEAHLDDVDRAHPEIAALVGDGSSFALSDGKGLLAHRLAHHKVHVYAAFRAEIDWAERLGLSFADAPAVRSVLLQMFDDWAPAWRALLMESEDAFIPRPLFALPVGHRWDSVPGVTLLGDAAHLMSPFSGQGANLAMLDAMDLAHAIAASPDLWTAVTRYEAILFPRAARSAADARDGLQAAIAKGGAEHAMAHWTSQMQR